MIIYLYNATRRYDFLKYFVGDKLSEVVAKWTWFNTFTHKIKKLILWTSVIHFFLGWSWEFGVLSGPEFLTLLLLILFWISFFVTFIISI